MEAVQNYTAIVFMYRSYSYEGLALQRCLHAIRYYYGVVERAKAGPKKQLTMVSNLVNNILAKNAASGVSGTPPCTYKDCMELVKVRHAGS